MTRRDPCEFAAAPWLDAPVDVLGPAARVPTMLAKDEQRLYHWLTWHWAEGCGAVVDLGCFAGGSTARLAEGHRAAGHSTRIHAYDRFRVSDALKARLLYPGGVTPFDGEDLLPTAQALLAPWADRISFHRGEIQDGAWADGPIEILVQDAAKSTVSTDAMAAMFFPSLIPGRSLVVHQDYLHWRLPWIAAQMQLMRDCFTPVAHARRDTLVFLCTGEVTPTVLAAGRVDGLDDKALIETLRAARPTYEQFGVTKRLRQTVQAIKANPGVRVGFKMKRP